jgi:8-oxo-dGTP diphosphatase
VTDEEWQAPSVLLTVDLVVLTLRDASLQVLLVQRGVEPYAGMMALPGGFLHDEAEPILNAAEMETAISPGRRRKQSRHWPRMTGAPTAGDFP